MPFDYDDVSQRVSAGSASAADSIENLSSKAAAADEAFSRLTRSQSAFGQGLDSTVRKVKSASSEFAGLVDDMGNASENARTLSDALDDTGSHADDIEDTADAMHELSEAAGRAAKVNLDHSARNDAKEIENLGRQAQNTGTFLDRLTNFKKNHSRITHDARKVTEHFVHDMEEGADQARRFAGDLDGVSTSVMAAGLATAFLLSKVADIARSFQGAALDLARFNVEMSMAGRVIDGIDSSGLQDFRRELGLTRDQASALFETLETGVNRGIAPLEQLQDAAFRLQAAFGGDPTKRLQEYVDLLQMIPTIETDISITASGDAADSLFALAREGKVRSVIELRAAGLLGADEPEPIEDNDVKLLNAAQKTQATMENIQDFLTGRLFNRTVLYGTAMIGGLATIGSVVTGSFVLLGGVKALLGTVRDETSEVQRAAAEGLDQVARTMVTTGVGIENAIRETAGMAASSSVNNTAVTIAATKANAMAGGTGQIAGMAANSAIRGGMSGGAGGAASAVWNTAKSIIILKLGGVLAKGTQKALAVAMPVLKKGLIVGGKALFGFAASIGGVAAGIAAAGFFASYALSSLGDKMVEDGRALSGSVVNMGGALAEAAGTIAAFAAVGSIIPGVGTAIGAAIGAIASVPRLASSAGASLAAFGDELQNAKDLDGLPKFNENMQFVGGVLSWVGDRVENFGDRLIDGFVNLGKGLWESAKAVAFWPIAVGRSLMSMNDKFMDMEASSNGVVRRLGELGRALTDAARGLAMSDSMVEQMRRSDDANREFANSLRAGADAFDLAAEARENMEDRMIRSAMGLQRALERTRNVVNSARLAVFDFQKEVAETEIGMLSKLGGDVQRFTDAISDAATASGDKFRTLTEALDRRRVDIITGSAAESKQRQQALQDLHKAEMDAVMEFVDGIRTAIDALFDMPDMMARQRRTRITQAEIELVGPGVEVDDILARAGRGLDETAGQLENVSEISRNISELQRQRDEAIEINMNNTLASLEGAMGSLPESVRKTIDEVGGLFKRVVGEDGQEDLVPNLDGAKRAREEFKAALEENEQETNRVLSLLPEEGVRSWSQRSGVIANNVKDFEREVNKIEEALKKAVANSDAEEASRLRENLELARENLSSAEDSQSGLNDEIEKFLRESEVSEDLIDDVARAFREGNTRAIMNNEEAIEEYLRVTAGQVQTAEQVRETMDEMNRLADERDALTQALLATETVMNSRQSLELQLLDDQLKLIEEAARVKGDYDQFLRTIVEAEGLALAQARRAASLADAQAAAQNSVRSGMEAVGNAIEAGIDVSTTAFRNAEGKMDLLVRERDALVAKLKELEADEDVDETVVMAVQGQLQKVDESMNEVAVEAQNAADSLNQSLDSFDRFNSALQASPMMQAAEANRAYADSLFAVAEYSEEGARRTEEAAMIAMHTLDERTNMERKASQEALAADMEVARQRAKLEGERVRIEGGGEAAVQEAESLMRFDLETAALARDRARMEEIATREVQEREQIARQILDFANRELDVRKEMLDVGMDLASTFDGSAEAISPFLEKQLQTERDRLEVSERYLAELRAAGITGVRLREAETNVVRQQADIRKMELDRVKQIADARRETLDIELQMVDDQMQFISEVGGSFEQIMNMTSQAVELERQKLLIAEQELAAAREQGLEGNKLRQMELDVQRQRFSYERRIMGAQRDAAERLAGAAFGAIRSSVGGAMNRGSDVALMGTDRTRVMGRGGLFMDDAKGGAGTMEERLLRIQLGAFDNEQGMADQLSVEELTRDNTGETAANTKRAAELLGTLTESATTPGSIYTHDMHVIEKLDEVGDELVRSISDFNDDFLDMFTIASLSSRVFERGGNMMAQQSAMEAFDDSRRGESAAPREVASSGMGIVPESVQLRGEMMVHFDNRLFKDQLVSVIGEMLTTVEVRKTLERSGFVNRMVT